MYMKTFLVSLLVLVVLGGAGFMGYKYLVNKAPVSQPAAQQNSMLSGTLLPGKGDDYQFVLLDASGKTTGVTSQTVQLGEFVNKKVEVTGSFSGSTLYVYTLTEK